MPASAAVSASRTPCSPTHLWLRQHGYVQAPILDKTTGPLSIAVTAFQAQLKDLSKQPAQDRHAGFQQLGKRQRLEFRAGDSALGQLGLLQSLATTVLDLQSF